MGGYVAAGIFALAMSISSPFASFANYGLRNYQVTLGKELYSDKQFLLARTITIVFSIIGCICYLIFARDYSAIERQSVFLYLIYCSINTLSDTIQGTLQNRNHLEVGGFSNAIRGIVCFLFFMTGYCRGKDIICSLSLMIIGTILVFAIYDLPCYIRSKVNSYPLEVCNRSCVSILKICFPLMLTQIVPLLTAAIPRRIIHTLYGAKVLGVYSTTFALTAVIILIASSLVTAVMPYVENDIKTKGREGLRKWITDGMLLCLCFCLIGIFGVHFFGKILLVTMFGEEIIPYQALLYWAVVAAIFSGMVSFFNGILTVISMLRVISVLSLVSFVITLLLSYFAVSRRGLFGAAQLQTTIYIVQVVIQIFAMYFYNNR